jgi:hypothetical protein
MKEIEDFLRENKPRVKNDPAFILEAQRRMESVEGIKSEVDRQHRRGRVALVVALAAGLAVGVLVTALAFLYPVDPESMADGFWDSARLFVQTWKMYLMVLVAVLAVALGLVLSRPSGAAIRS